MVNALDALWIYELVLPFCHLTLKAKRPRNPAYPVELRTVGDHLRKRRLDLGLLQREVADQLQVDEASGYNWETNRTMPEIRFTLVSLNSWGTAPSRYRRSWVKGSCTTGRPRVYRAIS